MKELLLFIGLFCAFTSLAQNTFTAIVKDESNEEPLVGASAVIKDTRIGATADLDGKLIIKNIPNGEHTIVFSSVGYESFEETFSFPLNNKEPYEVSLEEGGEEFEAVYISATRTGRTIDDTPTRTEVIGGEELGEKAMMNSTNIAMILRESTGIMVQQTSANSANQSLRIQGLDGRYTQLLKDGFPVYGGFSSGLSIMQVPPLDLQQVEVIKGSASTLYGGGAIAGLVNLVTKQPEEDKPELNFMLDQTSALGTTLNAFWSQRFEKTGITFYTSANNQLAYDVNGDDFTELPESKSLSVNPKFFWYISDSTTLWLGVNAAFDDRLGGDLTLINGDADTTHAFSEQNLSKRLSSQLHFDHHLKEGGLLTIRNSVNYFDRNIMIPNYAFNGQQIASFSEATWSKEKENMDWIVGANLFTDNFQEQPDTSQALLRDYELITTGIFTQNNWNINKKLILESGFRADYNTRFGFFPLPRVSLLMKLTDHITSRVGGGLGYKLPTVFNEESESLSFQGVEPIDVNLIQPENSQGLNIDFNYKGLIKDEVSISFNQLFFYTQLTNSLVLQSDSTGLSFEFANANGAVESKGFETNLKLTAGDFKLFLQYAYTDVELKYDNINNQKPLTPKHSAGAVLMYEKEEKWRIGFEAYYTGRQFRSDYSETRDFWTMGLMVSRQFERFGVYVNFENFIDTRLSRYQSSIVPPHSSPQFREIWAPTSGFIANAGISFKLFTEEEG